MRPQSTILRFVEASSPEAITEIIEAFPFKVEIKGPPQQLAGGDFIVWYTTDMPGVKVKNIRLRGRAMPRGMNARRQTDNQGS